MQTRSIKQIPAAATISDGYNSQVRDHIAANVVDQWLDVIAAQREAQNTHNTLYSWKNIDKIGATPEKQRIWINRQADKLGEMLLRAHAEVGKRCRYKFAIDTLHVSTVATSMMPWHKGEDDGETVRWLSGLRTRIWRDGVKGSPWGDGFIIAAYSRHALVRLLQRANCHNAEELKAAFADAWDRLVIAAAVTTRWGHKRPERTWLIPVHVSTCVEPLVLVISVVTDENEDSCAVVKTVMPLSFVRGPDIDAVEALDSYLASATVEDALGDGLKTIEALVAKCESGCR